MVSTESFPLRPLDAQDEALLSAARGFGASARKVPHLILPKTRHETYTVAVALA